MESYLLGRKNNAQDAYKVKPIKRADHIDTKSQLIYPESHILPKTKQKNMVSRRQPRNVLILTGGVAFTGRRWPSESRNPLPYPNQT